jgi:hypothetical protein
VGLVIKRCNGAYQERCKSAAPDIFRQGMKHIYSGNVHVTKKFEKIALKRYVVVDAIFKKNMAGELKSHGRAEI